MQRLHGNRSCSPISVAIIRPLRGDRWQNEAVCVTVASSASFKMRSDGVTLDLGNALKNEVQRHRLVAGPSS